MSDDQAAIADIEHTLGVTFSEQHRKALVDARDPIHEACDFLVPNSPYELLRIRDVNRDLHSPEHPDPWPAFLIAFASNGCGDYFAIKVGNDGRTSITYMDPDKSVDENLCSDDRSMDFQTFDEWYSHKLGDTPG